jgi:hypothetical protein
MAALVGMQQFNRIISQLGGIVGAHRSGTNTAGSQTPPMLTCDQADA